MDPPFEDLLRRLDPLPAEFRELRDGVRKAVLVADLDPEMALTRCRKVLELVVRDVYQRRVGEPAGTRPLENLLQRLLKEGHLPARLAAYANAVRELGNVGTHRFGEQVGPADVRQSLSQLVPVLEWYVQVERPAVAVPPPAPPPESAPGTARGPAPRPAPRSVIVPKGLRSFDATDADFFLDLLPGPRDRTGLPDSLRFWKHAIEEASEPAFTVGVLYGPSGCGKSSLVKAGLLPRLTDRILSVYVEAAAHDTEARLLAGLRRRYSSLPADRDLVASVAQLRQEKGLGRGRKVLVVLDQFEQWLHGRRAEEDPELARALRQCDGERVQALLLVRDDFWMGLTRFLGELSIDLVQGQNCAAVDLFDRAHARDVLAALGRAYGRLADEPDREQAAFLDRAVEGLAEDGRVVPVRLALFAEMVKGRPWTPATLKEVGGAAGVGVAFLEETFAARAAPAKYRRHQEAARAVLRALLPEQGTDIKGNMQSRAKLLQASGYGDRPRDFEELLRILDGELRLITPTEPPGAGAPDEPYYQLTHDYLVPALRDWLARKQKETRRGRAELRLAERAAAWVAKPESRHLPAWWEWLDVRLFTRKKDWTPPQRAMMRRAARFHLTRGALAAAVVTAAVLVGVSVWGQVNEQRQRDRAADLVGALETAETADVPKLVEELGPYRRWADPLLRQDAAAAADDSKKRLHAALALLPDDDSQADYLADRLLEGTPDEVRVIRDALQGRGADLAKRYWKVLEDRRADPVRRLRAACALAAFDPDGDRWADVGRDVAEALVRQNALLASRWAEALRPVRGRLIPALAFVLRSAAWSEAERDLAADLLADYAADRPEVLADLLPDADPKAYGVLFPALERHRERAVGLLSAELERTAAWHWQDDPLNPAWPAPDPALVRQVEAAQGLVGERFALCQTLPLGQFDAVAEGLSRSGYRPVRLRPFFSASPPAGAEGRGEGGGVLVAAVWARDGVPWQASHGLTAEEVRRQDGELREQGYQPADVAGYLDGGLERYAALWVEADPGYETQLYVGLSDRWHELAGWGPLRARGLQPARTQTFLTSGGQARYSGVWGKGISGSSSWNLDEGTYADRGLSDGRPVDVSLSDNRGAFDPARAELLAWLSGSPWAGLGLRRQNLAVPHPERSYAGCFSRNADFDYALALGLTPERQRQRARELAGQGYRPGALSVAEVGPGRQRVTASVWYRPAALDAEKEWLAKRQASAAVALLRLGQAERVWPLLRHRPDPRLRSYLIDRLRPLGADAGALVRHLAEEPDTSARRALLLALGEFNPENLPAAEREALVPRLLQLYRDDPDPGLHGAAKWLLRRWQQDDKLGEIDKDLASGKVEGQRRWYVNGQAQTFTVIPGPVEFVMGSPLAEADREEGPEGQTEAQHRRRIGRSFALATREVTVEQFLRFRHGQSYSKQISPTPADTLNGVTWYEAAAYCNWLSDREGIAEDQWCYEPNRQGQFAEGMRVKPDYLSRTGYRLPTEAEWEYACRAGSVTSRYYGETAELLGKYAWTTKDSHDSGMLPPGGFKPNDLGLFDMLGNADEWCQDGVGLYPSGSHGEAVPDQEGKDDLKGIKDRIDRMARGGAFTGRVSNARSAARLLFPPASRE